LQQTEGKTMSSHSQFGPDPSAANAHDIAFGGVAVAAGIASVVGLGLVNAMAARSLADGRAITVAEWQATVDFLEACCRRLDKQVKGQSLEILQLHARLEIALFRGRKPN
jgi:hypothetical protein